MAEERAIAEKRAMAEERILGIPSWKAIGAALVIMGLFMLLACWLYSSNYGGTTSSTNAYLLKVGDALITGAIVGIFVALLKGIFDLPKWWREWRAPRNT